MDELDSNLEKARRHTEKLNEVKREMQSALLLEGAPSDEDKDEFDGYVIDWISENRDRFMEAFEKMEAGTEDIVEVWKKDKEGSLAQMKKLMK